MSDSRIFEQIAVMRPKRSYFDLTHDFKFSCDPGQLIPVNVMECLPGDHFKLGVHSLIRFSPLISPMFHNVKAYFYSFFCPNRILWDQFEHAMTMTDDPNTADPPVFPFVNIASADADIGSLADYMGVPQDSIGFGGQLRLNPLAFAAYQRIYYDYFMYRNDLPGDIEPDPALGTLLVSGDNTANWSALNNLRNKGWNHDYFTSALTSAQVGLQVEVPLGDVYLKNGWSNLEPELPRFTDVGGNFQPGALNQVASGGPLGQDAIEAAASTNVVAYDPAGTLSTAPITINELRRVEHLQEFLELMGRGGNRYTEMTKNFFSTDTGDARLQRTEYIGGNITPVQISEVLNTTGIDGELPQGNMAGHAAAAVSSKIGSYHCKEHGYIITLMCVIPDTAYQQGLPRHYMRFDPTDYFWPQFEGLGEQEVFNCEVLARYDDSTNDLGTFGYQPRHSEYKYLNNRVAGLFKTTLKNWHWGRIFTAPPVLSPSFITAQPRTDIYAVTSGTGNKLWCDVGNVVKATRPMRKFTIPHL